MRALPARADAHHRPRVHSDLGELLHEVHLEDRGGHHAAARHHAARGEVQGVPHLPPRPPPFTTEASARRWRTTSPRWASCCGKATLRAGRRRQRVRPGTRRARRARRQARQVHRVRRARRVATASAAGAPSAAPRRGPRAASGEPSQPDSAPHIEQPHLL